MNEHSDSHIKTKQLCIGYFLRIDSHISFVEDSQRKPRALQNSRERNSQGKHTNDDGGEKNG